MTALPMMLAQSPDSQNVLRAGLLLGLLVLPFVAAFVAIRIANLRRLRAEAEALSELTGSQSGAAFGSDAGAGDDWLSGALAADEDETAQSWTAALLNDASPEQAREEKASSRLSFLRRKSAESDPGEATFPVEQPPVVEAVAPVQDLSAGMSGLPRRVRPEAAPTVAIPVASEVEQAPVYPAAAISFEKAEPSASADDWAEHGGGTDESSSTWWQQAQEDDRG